MNTLLNTENSFCEITIMYSSTGDRIVHKREITGHRGRKGQDIYYYYFLFITIHFRFVRASGMLKQPARRHTCLFIMQK